MNYFFKILFLFLMTSSLTGCSKPERGPQTKGIKIGELAPTGRSPQRPVQPEILKTTNFNVITYEVPADNIIALDNIWRILNSSSFKYNDANGFSANGLQAGAGRTATLAKVIAILKSANAKKLYTTALLVQPVQPEMIDIVRLTRKTTIFYIGRQGVITSSEAGPGVVGLQIMVRQVTGPRMEASIQITPVISAPTEGLPPELATRIKAKDIRFYSAGFGLNMQPGDFLVLAPNQVSPMNEAAVSRFFMKAGQNPTIKVFLLVCTSVT